MKVSVIGPTDVDTLSATLNKTKEEVLDVASQIGNTIADAGHELWVNSDGGMLAAVAKAYKVKGGKKLVLLVPREGEPWPIDHTKPHLEIADEIQKRKDWFYTNYAVVSEVDVCICVGLSSGTFSELAYIKWDKKFQRGVLKKLLLMNELVRDGGLPPEFSTKFRDILMYVDSSQELSGILNEQQGAF